MTAPDVGYQPLPLTFVKTSDAPNHQVAPGQTITYTLAITNNTATTQTGIDVDDPLPTGTTYVPGSTVATIPQQVSVRVSQSSDDAEENASTGGMSTGSSGLRARIDSTR